MCYLWKALGLAVFVSLIISLVDWSYTTWLKLVKCFSSTKQTVFAKQIVQFALLCLLLVPCFGLSHGLQEGVSNLFSSHTTQLGMMNKTDINFSKYAKNVICFFLFIMFVLVSWLDCYFRVITETHEKRHQLICTFGWTNRTTINLSNCKQILF